LRLDSAVRDTRSRCATLVLGLHVMADLQMKRLCALVLALAATGAVTACSPVYTLPRPPATGTVRGVLLFGGPGPVKPVPGQVTASAQTGEGGITIVHAGIGGRFFMTLAVGTYEFTGSSPEVRLNGEEVICSASRSVRVRAHEAVSDIRVLCTLI